MKRIVAGLALAALAAACAPAGERADAQSAGQQASPQQVAAPAKPLPDQTAVRITGADRQPLLQGWSPTPAPQSKDVLRYSHHSAPDNPAFAGARAFSSAVRETNAAAAAKKALAVEGFEMTAVLAEAKAKQAVMDRLETGSWGTALTAAGKIDGKPARFIGVVWYGAMGEPDGKPAAGVAGFMAPEPAFVALGGYAVPAILFYSATATPDTPMSVDGSEPPQKAAQLMADMFSAWAGTLNRADLSGLAANGIMNGNLGVTGATGCINMYGCVGGGMPPIRLPNN